MSARTIASARLLSADASAEVLSHAEVRACALSPLEVSASADGTPRATLTVPLVGDGPAWQTGRLLRVEYYGPGAGEGDVECWRIIGRSERHAEQARVEIAMQPRWMDAAQTVLLFELATTTVTTQAVSLVSRPLLDALGVIFDPANGALSNAVGAPLFVVGTIAEELAGLTVDLSLMTGSVVEALDALCDDLRCLWRARYVMAGFEDGEELYEIDLLLPSEDVAGDVAAFLRAAPAAEVATLKGFDEPPAGGVGSRVPTARSLTATDDLVEVVTGIVPLAALRSGGTVDASGATFYPLSYELAEGTVYEVRLSTPDGRTSVIPYDGALVGERARFLDPDGDEDLLLEILDSRAPNVIEVDKGGELLNVLLRDVRFVHADGRPVMRLVHAPAATAYGLRTVARVYEEVAALENRAPNPTVSVEGISGGEPFPFSFQRSSDVFVTWAWTSADNDVAHGTRSARFTATAADQWVRTGAADLPNGPRAAWVSMRVVSGEVAVTLAEAPAARVVMVASEVLTTVELVHADPDVTCEVVFEPLGTDAEWVVDAVTIVAGVEPTPYRSLSGPAALWVRAWDDLVRAPSRMTSLDVGWIDLGAVEGPDGEPLEEDLAVGDWVTVGLEDGAGGVRRVRVQLLDSVVSWSLVDGRRMPERRGRLGPPPVRIADLLAERRARAVSAPGSRTAPVLPKLLDAGAMVGAGDVIGARSADAADGAVLGAGVALRSFLAVDYELETVTQDPISRALTVRRVPGRDDAALIHLDNG